MKNFLYKKIVPIILIISFISPSLFVPKNVKAQLTVTDPGNTATGVGNLVQNIIQTVKSVGSYVLQYSMQYKEYVLDPLASGFAKAIIRQITSSIVNWINSGFQGSPSFVQNPGAFFLDIADQATGQFIAKSGVLSSLCSPFNLDIRLALAFKYRPRTNQRYACTLGTIIKNSKNAIKGASINGFTAGDFRQGGWPAFVSLTTEPQNNIYGAYLQADSDLSFRVSSLQSQQKDELGQGKGFLSWRECPKGNKVSTVDGHKPAVQVQADGPVQEGAQAPTAQILESECPIKTPGSVIAGALDTQLGSPVRQLELADEIGEIVNALFAQLIVQVMKAGLSSMSQKDSSGSSYLDKTINDLQDKQLVDNTKNTILTNMTSYITSTEEYKKNSDEALAIVTNINNSYKNVISCYQAKMIATSSNITQNEIGMAVTRIQGINGILNGALAATTTLLFNQAQDADYRLTTLKNIQASTTAATTLSEISIPSNAFSQLIGSQSLTDVLEIQKSVDNLAGIKRISVPLIQDATNKLRECQSFPENTRNKGGLF